MPAGCDFICKNEDCDNFNTGFTITAPWPMGLIDDIINSNRVKELPELRKQIEELKELGSEYACITFPNVNNVETKCYRVSFWSAEGKCIWKYDIINNGINLEESIKKANLPQKCPNTGSNMLNYSEVIKEGIKCPSCDNILNQNRWFAKEI